MKQSPPNCPFCRSKNVLPFEEDKPGFTATIPVVILAALTIISLYFLVIMISHIHYPLIILIFVAVAGMALGRQEKRKKRSTISEKSFLCLNCDRDFRAKS